MILEKYFCRKKNSGKEIPINHLPMYCLFSLIALQIKQIKVPSMCHDTRQGPSYTTGKQHKDLRMFLPLRLTPSVL